MNEFPPKPKKKEVLGTYIDEKTGVEKKVYEGDARWTKKDGKHGPAIGIARTLYEEKIAKSIPEEIDLSPEGKHVIPEDLSAATNSPTSEKMVLIRQKRLSQLEAKHKNRPEQTTEREKALIEYLQTDQEFRKLRDELEKNEYQNKIQRKEALKKFAFLKENRKALVRKRRLVFLQDLGNRNPEKRTDLEKSAYKHAEAFQKMERKEQLTGFGMRWYQKTLGKLDPKHRMIISATLGSLAGVATGATFANIAGRLLVSMPVGMLTGMKVGQLTEKILDWDTKKMSGKMKGEALGKNSLDLTSKESIENFENLLQENMSKLSRKEKRSVWLKTGMSFAAAAGVSQLSSKWLLGGGLADIKTKAEPFFSSSSQTNTSLDAIIDSSGGSPEIPSKISIEVPKGEGAISAIVELKEALRAEYPDSGSQPDIVKNILDTRADALAEKYGFYKPGSIDESALLMEGDKFSVGEDGSLLYEKAGGETVLLEDGGDLSTVEGKFGDRGGKMFDYDATEETPNIPKQIIPAENTSDIPPTSGHEPPFWDDGTETFSKNALIGNMANRLAEIPDVGRIRMANPEMFGENVWTFEKWGSKINVRLETDSVTGGLKAVILPEALDREIMGPLRQQALATGDFASVYQKIFPKASSIHEISGENLQNNIALKLKELFIKSGPSKGLLDRPDVGGGR